MTRRRTRITGSTTPAPLAALALGLAIAAGASGQVPLSAEGVPAELEGVGIDQRLGEFVPLDLPFVDDTGEPVVIGDYFQPDQPVILTLNYYRCPMLCTLTLNGLVDALNEIDWSAGREFQIVTVSIAHEEGPELAEVKKRSYLTAYDRETAAEGWHFLTGGKESIEALTGATGFGFRHDERTGEYAHASTIIFITPDGRISRYLDDVLFDPKDVRFALVEASQGAIGTPMEKFLLFTCFQYDPEANSYALSALKLMRLGGVVTLFALVAGFVVIRRRGPKTGQEKKIALGGLHP